jgi:hypothetical protein
MSRVTTVHARVISFKMFFFTKIFGKFFFCQVWFVMNYSRKYSTIFKKVIGVKALI